MSLLPPFRPGAIAMPVYAPDYIARLERQRDAINRLCIAARDLLCADIDETLERVKNPPPNAPIIRPSIETLVTAQRERDQIQAQIDSLTRLCDEVPDAQADFLRTMQMPSLEESLKRADEWLATIQKGLEASGDSA